MFSSITRDENDVEHSVHWGINLGYFRFLFIFYMKIVPLPWKKSPSSFPGTPGKVEVLSSPPLFWKFGWRLNPPPPPPPPAERGGAHYVETSMKLELQTALRGWMWRFGGRLRTKERSSCISFACFCRCWCFCPFCCEFPHAKSNVLRMLAINLCLIYFRSRNLQIVFWINEPIILKRRFSVLRSRNYLILKKQV